MSKVSASALRDDFFVASPARLPRIVELHAVNAADDAARLLAGLLARDARTDPKFFYDAQGSALFDAICHLDEYHPTRIEAAIFRDARVAIAREIGREFPAGYQWVDLGCGDAAKSRDWLAAVAPRRYVGVDIAEAWLAPAVARIAEAFPDLDAIGVVADLARPLTLAPVLNEVAEAPLFFYPGSSIGNFEPPRAVAMLKALRQLGGGRGGVLIGVDCESDPQRLEAAYDDALGVTAAFNRNVLRVANRVLGADFDLRAYAHRAWFNEVDSRVEMHLVARSPQTVRFQRPHPAERDFEADEVIVTEYSCKYTPASFAALLDAAGFRRQRVWQDPAQRFAVVLATA
ncbi:L-histidine N(alpha)-methyltransferase [Nevskia sp.]|uniref:L-histidine N(alpha)-methyltransferase n=1 Tax=Nevskia sp. TaxID=1929292 RepID=UPI0025D1848F|nr:L-histidine N(alpha)-methyltransferase [Nevskia sp.]